MQTLLYIYILGGLILALLALPLIAGKIKPNPYYGFRVPKTLENPELWYLTNKYFAMRQFALGVIFSVVSIGLYFWPGISLDAYAWSCLGVFLLIFIWAIVQSWRYMKTL
jgi:hypothetical protein